MTKVPFENVNALILLSTVRRLPLPVRSHRPMPWLYARPNVPKVRSALFDPVMPPAMLLSVELSLVEPKPSVASSSQLVLMRQPRYGAMVLPLPLILPPLKLVLMRVRSSAL